MNKIRTDFWKILVLFKNWSPILIYYILSWFTIVPHGNCQKNGGAIAHFETTLANTPHDHWLNNSDGYHPQFAQILNISQCCTKAHHGCFNLPKIAIVVT